MKRSRAWGEWVGGIMRAPRLYYAVLPVAVPLIVATVTSTPEVTQQTRSLTASKPPRIEYAMLGKTSAPLPSHSVCLTIDPGDTLDAVLTAGGLTSPEAAALTGEFAKSIDLRRLKPGEMVRFRYASAGTVDQVVMKVTGWGEVTAERAGDGFQVAAVKAPETTQQTTVTASIDSSLYEAITTSGENPQLVPSLVDVFQWDVDFFSLQEGDRFSLVVDKKYCGSDFVGYGPILAARFTHKGETYEAYRFETANGAGYYTAAGRPVKKQFLKAPLRFTRITSGFTNRRFHPILGIFRAHHGVDYGAPVGTPVMSTADGVVVAATRGGGEGNFIRIKHSSRIETYYMHLSRFAKGLGKGTRVKQGDVIGYVGSTGLSTGPHLDYRITDGGTWLNPVKMKSITPDALSGEQVRRFRASVGPLVAKLDAARPTEQVARNDSKRPSLF